MGRRRTLLSTLFAVALATGLIAPTLASGAAPTAVVTMGDSYISGEAGRWLGNSPNLVGDRDGTDRACILVLTLCVGYDESKVYGASGANGCHRSDVAEVRSAQLPVDRRINIACSGAVTSDLFRASSGGTMPHGETPQGDQLLPVAQANRVRMIVVSVGGNDLGFASIVQACFTAYLTKTTPCSQSQAGALSDANLAAAATKVKKVIDEIRAVMRRAGYANSGYRLVLQTYPAVLPRAADARYAELSPERTVYGCPFYDADLNWGHDFAAARIGSMVKSAAAARGVETLDTLNAFDGHEFCAKTAAASTPLARPPASGAEWGRAISASTIAQGEVQEVFHPDAYGQMALGNCLTRLYAASRGNHRCTGAAGRAPQQMVLTRTG